MKNIYNIHKKQHKQKGFTLIEILVVIGIIAILAAVVLVAVNPGRQFKQARDSQRLANINTILNALGQNISDHQGVLQCQGSTEHLPTTMTQIGTDTGQFDLADCVVPDYLPKLPYDPYAGRGYYDTEDNYKLGYSVSENDDRITVVADGELQGDLSVTR
jgi:prepilin-type N-terminal cleavage/methylation domain-containing protein